MLEAPAAITVPSFNIAGRPASERFCNRRPYVSFVEPPSSNGTLVLVGKNSRGQWVAREQNGLFGGLFVSRSAAVRYALFENGHRLEAIHPSPGPLELEIGGAPSARAGNDETSRRRAA
jgi:hypothetical protein